MRKRMWRFGAILLVLGLLSAGAHGVEVSPVPLVKAGSSDYIIVTGTNGLYDRFAVGEFKEIMEKSLIFQRNQRGGTPNRQILFLDFKKSHFFD